MPWYTSPDLFLGSEALSALTLGDIWSVGCIVAEMGTADRKALLQGGVLANQFTLSWAALVRLLAHVSSSPLITQMRSSISSCSCIDCKGRRHWLVTPPC